MTISLTTDFSYGIDSVDSALRVSGFCIDQAENTAYVIETTQRNIYSLNLATGDWAELYTGIFTPGGALLQIFLSADESSLIVTESNAGQNSKIFALATDGSTSTPTVLADYSSAITAPPSQGFYDATDNVYYSAGFTGRSLYRFDLNSPPAPPELMHLLTGINTIVRGASGWPADTTKILYSAANCLMTYDLNGGFMTILLGNGTDVTPVDGANRFDAGEDRASTLAADSAGRVYFNSGGAIWVLDTDENMHQLATSGASEASDFILRGQKLYSGNGVRNVSRFSILEV